MSVRARRVIAGTCSLAVAVATSAPACSSKEPAHPPLLGNCVPVDGASCNPPLGSGVGGPPVGDAAREEDAGGGIAEAGSCGVAANYFQPPNPDCLPCIESVCCMALLACTSSPDCRSLLFCAQAPCDAGSATCLAACEANDTLAVVMAYQDLATCLSMSCYPQCQMLPVQVSPSDL